MTVTVALLAVAATAAVPLRPDLPAVAPQTAAPALYATVPDADLLPQPPALEPSRPFTWVVSPGEPFAVTARVPAVAGADRAVLTVWDWNNTPVHQQTLAGATEQPIAFEVSGRGTWLLTLDLLAGERCLGRLARSF